MRIVFLGTSHGLHTSSRYNTATLLEVGETHYLIDCGEPVAGTLTRLGIGTSRLRALFVTHLHGDHMGGLTQLTNTLALRPGPGQLVTYYLPAEGVANLTLYLKTIYLEPETAETPVALRPVKSGDFYEDGLIKVRAVHNAHLTGSFEKMDLGEAPNSGQSYSYVIEGEGKRLAFSGDICGPLKDHALDHLVNEELDLLVMEMTHVQPTGILPVVGGMRIGQVALNHIHDPWEGEGEAALAAHCEKYLSCPFTIAHDGEELVL